MDASTSAGILCETPKTAFTSITNAKSFVSKIGNEAHEQSDVDEYQSGVHQTTFECHDGYIFTNDRLNQTYTCSQNGSFGVWLPVNSSEAPEGCIGIIVDHLCSFVFYFHLTKIRACFGNYALL